MMARRASLIGATVVAVALLAGTSGADVIHLTTGQTIETDAWRDVGDAIEFERGGGIIRIAKSDIARIDGRSQKSDLRLYPGAASVSVPGAPADRGAALKGMVDLLAQGEGLFGQSVLSASEKARAFRKLRESWDGLSVPDALRAEHEKGQQVIQLATEAFVAEDEDVVPDARERVEAAKKALEDALAQLKKAGESS